MNLWACALDAAGKFAFGASLSLLSLAFEPKLKKLVFPTPAFPLAPWYCRYIFGEFDVLGNQPAFNNPQFLIVAGMGGIIGFAISFSSLWFLSQASLSFQLLLLWVRAVSIMGGNGSLQLFKRTLSLTFAAPVGKAPFLSQCPFIFAFLSPLFWFRGLTEVARGVQWRRGEFQYHVLA